MLNVPKGTKGVKTMADWKRIEGIKIALQKTVNETNNELHKKRLTNIIKDLSKIQEEDY